MSKIEVFEDLKVWQDARVFVQRIYAVTHQKTFARDYVLRDQISRSSISIMSNIAEGFDRSSKNEFILFLNYAKASAAEVRSQLYTCLDMGYISEADFVSLKQEALSLSRQIAGFMKYLEKSKKRAIS
jgi:four helix bundle protein